MLYKNAVKQNFTFILLFHFPWQTKFKSDHTHLLHLYVHWAAQINILAQKLLCMCVHELSLCCLHYYGMVLVWQKGPNQLPRDLDGVPLPRHKKRQAAHSLQKRPQQHQAA